MQKDGKAQSHPSGSFHQELQKPVAYRMTSSPRSGSHRASGTGFNPVQTRLQTQLLRPTSWPSYTTATVELFRSSFNLCMAKTMEHLSEFVFINMVNMTLFRRDAYLSHVKSGIK